jgi:hypothetical protein
MRLCNICGAHARKHAPESRNLLITAWSKLQVAHAIRPTSRQARAGAGCAPVAEQAAGGPLARVTAVQPAV